MQRNYVFFYGLFMDADLLRSKGVQPGNGEVSFVDGYALRIGQRATLIPMSGRRVHGVVFSLTADDLDRLYSEPGLQAYQPQTVLAELASGSAVQALCYVLEQPPLPSEHNREYAVKLKALAQKIGLPTDHIPD